MALLLCPVNKSGFGRSTLHPYDLDLQQIRATHTYGDFVSGRPYEPMIEFGLNCESEQ